MSEYSIPLPTTTCRDGIEITVPLPVRNTIQGGAHGVIKAKVGNRTLKYVMSDLSIQERHLIPLTYDMRTNQEMANTIQDVAMNLIFSKEGMRVMGTCNEGGIGAFFRSWGELGAWKILAEAVEEAGYTLGREVCFGVDGAADRFYKGNGVYELDGRSFDTMQLMEYYESMLDTYPILYAEDLFASRKEAWRHWSEFTSRFGERVFVSLDDVATTNARLVRPLIAEKTGNMLLLKMNQIGTMLEGWRAAETAHHAGWLTISSHRSTSSIDFMEVEVALALSMRRPGLGRCVFAKWGGAKLIERAMRYAMAQQWVEDFAAGVALFEPLSPDTRIQMFKGYPAPLNTGDLTLGVRIRLSNGFEINAVVPAGTSTGETEACLVPVVDAVRNVDQLVSELHLVGMRLGDVPDQLTLTQRLLATELQEASRIGQIKPDDSVGKLQEAAELKRCLGANTLLGITVAYNRLIAVKEGKPSWLSLREAGQKLDRDGLTLCDEAFYEPIIASLRQTHHPSSRGTRLFGAAGTEL